MNINQFRAATAALLPPYAPAVLPVEHDSPADARSWCLHNYSGGPCPADGRNTWLTGLAHFCNESGVAEGEFLSWALNHPPLHTHGEKRITNTITGIYQRKLSDHNTKPYTPFVSKQGNSDKSAVASPPVAWPSPGSLTVRLRPVPTFDETMFPPALLPALRDVAHRMHCPPDWLAASWMVVLGAVVGNRCGIRPKQLDTGWLEVPNLWGAIVAEPSKLKTPALNAALFPLKELDRAAREEHRQNARVHEADAEFFKAQKDVLKKKLNKAVEKGPEGEINRLRTELAELEATPPPVAKRYIVTDSTVEKLVVLLGDNPRGLLVFRDELVGLLQSWDKQGRETDRQFYLEAWNGTGDFGSDRIGRGSQHVENCCVSLLGGIQPDKLACYLRQTQHGQNDGMTQRFSLLTWPDPLPYVYVDAVPDHAAQARAADLLRCLDELDPVAAGATLRAGDTIPAFHFDPAAQIAFVGWLTTWQQALDTSDESSELVQHLTKYRKLYPTLALLFHLLDIVSGAVPPGPVSHAATELAGKWCTYFAAHARRLYAYGAGSHAETLGKHLRSGKLASPFNLRDVQRKGWQGLTDGDAIQATLDELLEAHWLREVLAPPAGGTGRPRSASYEISPHVNSKI